MSRVKDGCLEELMELDEATATLDNTRPARDRYGESRGPGPRVKGLEAFRTSWRQRRQAILEAGAKPKIDPDRRRRARLQLTWPITQDQDQATRFLPSGAFLWKA